MSERDQFKATLQLLVPLIIKEIIKASNVSDQEAFALLYSSFVLQRTSLKTSTDS
ncbi:MAG: hypothetical protein LBQ42_08365 [Synergistaceae bacterium]|jgi:hypothetical protein|nr:hypothetical protein [Synergistaceae bacterium]